MPTPITSSKVARAVEDPLGAGSPAPRPTPLSCPPPASARPSPSVSGAWAGWARTTSGSPASPALRRSSPSTRCPAPEKRAVEFGADVALDPAAPDFAEQVRTATGRRGLDFAFDCAGVPAVREQAAAVLGPRAALILVGISPAADHQRRPDLQLPVQAGARALRRHSEERRRAGAAGLPRPSRPRPVDHGAPPARGCRRGGPPAGAQDRRPDPPRARLPTQTGAAR